MFDILIVCALSIEAKPIVKHYKLQHISSEYGYKIYGHRHGKAQRGCSIGVLITGVGKLNMSAALMWSQQMRPARSFLNVGIVGHGSAAIGDKLLVNKVFDDSKGTSSFPAINFPWKKEFTQLKTVDVPSKEYAEGCAYDMEASAFFYIANKFVSNDKSQSLKIVSDNAECSHELISSKTVSELIGSLLAQIEELVSVLVDPRESVSESVLDEIALMKANWHITLQQELQLTTLCASVLVMQKNTGEIAPQWQSFSCAKDYIFSINKWLNSVSPKLVL